MWHSDTTFPLHHTQTIHTNTHRVTVYPFGSIVHVTWYICSPFTEERTRFLILPCNIILILILQSCQLEFLFFSLFFHFSLFLSLSHITPNASNKTTVFRYSTANHRTCCPIQRLSMKQSCVTNGNVLTAHKMTTEFKRVRLIANEWCTLPSVYTHTCLERHCLASCLCFNAKRICIECSIYL